MSHRCVRLFLLAAVFCACRLSTLAQPPVAQEAKPQAGERHAALDLYGDPLPPGVVGRLGTLRFRQPGYRRTLAFAPDGRTLVSAAEDSSLHVWKADDGRLLRRLENGPDHAAAYSPDGKLLVAVGRLRQGNEAGMWAIRFWDAVTARELRTIKDVDRALPLSVVFAPDGKTLLTAHEDGTVRAWDVASGKELRRITLPNRSQTPLPLAAAGKLVAVVAQERRGQTIQLWKWQSNEPPRPLLTLERSVLSLAFSPDGTLLATGSDDRIGVRLWDPTTGRLLRELPFQDGWSYPQALDFSPDGKLLAATDGREGIVLWDARTWVRRPSLPVSGDLVMSLAFAPDGRRLAVGTESGVRVWDVATRQAIADSGEAHRGGVTQVAFSAEAGVVVTAAHDKTIRFWDVATGRQRRVLQVGPWTSFALSPNGKRLVTVSHDDTVRLWDAASGAQLFKLYGHGTSGTHYCAHFLPDGERFATFGQDRYLRVWRAANGKALREHPVRIGGIGPSDDDENGSDRARAAALEELRLAARATFTPDGKQMVLPDGIHLHVIDLDTGKEVRKLIHAARGPVVAPVVSPDGRWLLSSTPGRSAVLVMHALASGKVVRRILIEEAGIGPVAFSPSGKFFAAANARGRGQLRLYETASGEVARTLDGFTGRVTGLSFSADGRLLASALNDTTVLLWDLSRTEAER